METVRKKKIPGWIHRKMPGGITRLNTSGCRYYGITGLDAGLKAWYTGMFVDDTREGWFDYRWVLDLAEGLMWENPHGISRESEDMYVERLREEKRRGGKNFAGRFCK